MKRWIGYLAVVIALGMASFRGTDIAKLAPVEAVWLSQSNGTVFLQTDTGDMGWGADVLGALENMKAAAPGEIFLETADYLIVEQGAENLLEETCSLLRPSCTVCTMAQIPDLEAAAQFLTVHNRGITLRAVQAGDISIPILNEQEGRFTWHDG